MFHFEKVNGPPLRRLLAVNRQNISYIEGAVRAYQESYFAKECPLSLVKTERVLVVPTELFHQLGHFQGFSADIARYFERLLAPEHTSYRPRDEVEEDPGFKQLIPYVILRYRTPEGETRLFQYTRGQGQGEKRLHAKRSIGIGGHISAVDATGDTAAHPYHEGMRRELEEEIFLDSPYRDTCLGLINDDETEVGRVHLGVVHLFDLEQPAVRPREDDICEARFSSLEELWQTRERFETWSQICLEALLQQH